MPDKHEFFPQPHGNPAWCFCRRPHCTGWAAYVNWFQDGNRSAGEPPDDAIEMARQITRTLTALTSYYSDLLGIKVDCNTALGLAAIDMAAKPTR
jgi:hypothetical protein